MKKISIGRESFPTLIVSVCLILLIPTAYAVVKNVTVVNNEGQPLANTKVTIEGIQHRLGYRLQ